jgi:hypothetical protein
MLTSSEPTGCKDEGREVDFPGELEETFQRGRPGIEGCRPWFDARDVTKTARQRLKQAFLFPRRTQENPRLVHRRLQDV